MSYLACPAGAAQIAKDSQTTITSDIIDINRKTRSVEFLRNVVVKSQDSVMKSEKMKIVYVEEDRNNGKSKIKKIEALGLVKIESKNIIATSKYGFYDPSQNLFVLERDVIVVEGGSTARGEKFVYNTVTQKGNFVGQQSSSLDKSKKPREAENSTSSKDNTSEIEGKKDNGRVTIIIQDELLEKKDKKK